MRNMKKLFAWLLVVVMVVGCFQNMKGIVVNATEVETQTTFNASTEYSLENGNPNGVWTYQSYLPNEQEKLSVLPLNQTSGWWGSNNVYVQNNADTGYENMLRMVPELSTKGAAVSFTAPYDGTIKITMNDGCVKSHTYNNHRSKFLMMKNAETMDGYPVDLGDGTTAGSNVYTFKPITLNVQKGDTITFAVLRQSDSQSGTSYISPIITYTEMEGTQLAFNASEQYSVDNGNPNGVWTYQAYLPNAEEKLSTLPLYNNQWWGSNIVYVQNNADTGYENMLRMVPELSTKGAAVSFTAPYSGEIEITMNDGCVKSHTYNNHRSQFLMLKNGETLEGYPVNLGDGTTAGSNVYTFKPITSNVQKGDTITFAILRQSDDQSGTSYISPVITYAKVVEDMGLSFPSDESITISDITADGFTMTWPEVENNDVECAYTVYVAETAFTEIPTEGGQTVTGTSYTWTGLTYGKSYHAAVVASDGTTVAWLATTEATTVIPDEYIFNASEQYSLDKGNPNGVWTYQAYKPNEEEKLITLPLNQDSSWWGYTNVYVQNNADGYVNMLRMVPELTTTGAAVSFTAPHSGTIEIAMNDGCVKSHTYNNHRSQFLMLKNGETLEGYPVNLGDGTTEGSNVYTFAPITSNVQKGDTITFAILRQSDSQSGTSYISPVIRYKGLGLTYYIDSAEGNDENAGITADEPWKTFDNLSNIQLDAGDKVLIKKGTTVTDQLVLKNAHGTEEKPIVIGTYGDAEAKPLLQYIVEEDSNTTQLESMAAPVIQLKDCHGIELDGLKISGTNGVDVGIHLKYNNTFNHEYVKIKNCDFTDLTGFTIEDYRAENTWEYCMATGICVSVNNYNIGVNDPGLIGLYIEGCTSTNCGTLLANAGNIQDTNEGDSPLVSGLYISDCTMQNNDYYGAYIGSVQNGYMTDCVIDTCGDATDFTPGTAGILISAKNFDIINTEIMNQQRGGQEYDGVGIDFEKNNEHVTVENCYIHDNAGAAIFFFDSGDGSVSANQNCSVLHNIFVNNAKEARGNVSLLDNYDPIADILIKSSKGYALKDSTICDNQYFNENSYNSLTQGTYSFYVQSEGDSTMQNTVEFSNNAPLASIDNINTFIEEKADVLAKVQESHKNDIHSSYTFDKTPLSDVELGHNLLAIGDVYQHSVDFSDTMNGVWKYRHYQDGVWADLEYNSTDIRWVNYGYDEETNTKVAGGAIIQKEYMHPHTYGQTVLEFVPNLTGKVHITLEETTISYKSDDGTYITILNQDLEPISAPIYLKDASNTSMTRKSYDLGYVVVNEGESVYFCLSKCENSQNDTTFIDPKIEYQVTGGSVNDDELIDVCDLVAMKRLETDTNASYNVNADYNADTKVNVTDLTYLRRYLVGYWD